MWVGTWNRDDAAHLARRAGFGATPSEVQELVQLGREGAVAKLVDYPESDAELAREMEGQGNSLALVEANEANGSAEAVQRLRQWWLYRMVRTRHPLREKLALFWHNHFATAESKIMRVALLRDQNELFRSLGAGSFRELLRGVAHDPAMLVFLDTRTSRKDAPNENWARELLELFTLGLDQYEQKDISEIARVFTGWGTPGQHIAQFRYTADDHDTGDKLVLGRRIAGRAGEAGLREGYEVLDLLLAQPACANFLARELACWFVAHDPPERIVQAMAARLRASDYSIRETLRSLFLSDAFYAPELRFSYHRTPIDFAVSAARALGLQNAHLFALPRFLKRMGQSPFQPPSVAGWDLGRAWVQSSFLIERFELALAFSRLPHTTRRVVGAAALDFDRLVEGARERAGATEGSGSPTANEITVRRLARRLLYGRLEADQEQILVRHLDELDRIAQAPRDPRTGERAAAGAPARDKTRALVHLLLSLPQFALA